MNQVQNHESEQVREGLISIAPKSLWHSAYFKVPKRPFVKNTVRHNPHLNALQGVSCLPVRTCPPHRQAPMAPHAALEPVVPAGEFHEAATCRIAIHSARSRPGRWILLWPISLWNGTITKVSGKDIKAFLFHSDMIQREWSRKEPISFPLCRRNESCRMEW